MPDLKNSESKKEVHPKSLSVFVYAEMKAAREMNPKNDSKRSNFQEKGVIMQKTLYNAYCWLYLLGIGLRLTMNCSRRGIWVFFKARVYIYSRLENFSEVYL